MSSTSRRPGQHLRPVDLAMIQRVHRKACSHHRFSNGSVEASQTAALIVREFQNGIRKEGDLSEAFMGQDDRMRLSVPAERMALFIGNDVRRWDREADAALLGFAGGDIVPAARP